MLCCFFFFKALLSLCVCLFQKKPRRINTKILIKPNNDSLSFYVVLSSFVLGDFLRKDDEGRVEA